MVSSNKGVSNPGPAQPDQPYQQFHMARIIWFVAISAILLAAAKMFLP